MVVVGIWLNLNGFFVFSCVLGRGGCSGCAVDVVVAIAPVVFCIELRY